MADFRKVIPLTLKYEGGLVNAKNDAGGITNFGISIRFAQSTRDLRLFDINRNGKIDSEDIRNLTLERACEIYKKYFWDIFDLDEITSDKKAFLFFDASVNHGGKMATKILQKAINECGGNLVVDGAFGKKTLSALEEVDEDCFVSNFQKKREDYYYAIVRSNASQKVFLKGWLNRIKKINQDVVEL